MPPRFRALLAAAALAGACQDVNHPPSLALVPDQWLFAGDELSVPLAGSDPDGDRLAFSVSGLPDAAAVVPAGGSAATLVWSPEVTDTDPGGRLYDAVVSVKDGRGGEASQGFSVTVFPALGVPVFDLPGGVVLNLAQSADLTLVVEVADADSTDVALGMAESPAGSKLSKAGGRSAFFYWKPDEAQRKVVVHRVVFTADDGVNAEVRHTLLVVLLHGDPGAECDGTPPTVSHTPLADFVLGSAALEVAAAVTDAESAVESVSLVWHEAGGSETTVDLARPDPAAPDWSTTFDPGSAPPGGKLVHYALVARDNDDPLGVSCDRETRLPKSGSFTFAVYPPGTPPGTCKDDPAEPDDALGSAPLLAPGLHDGRRLCGDAPDVAEVSLEPGSVLTAKVLREPSHGAVVLRILSPGGALLAEDTSGSSVLSASAAAGAGASLFAEVSPAGVGAAALSYALDLAVAESSCEDSDAFEPNDSPATAPDLAPGTHADLVLCPGGADLYAVSLAAGERLDASLSFDHAQGDLDLRLLDASGSTVLAASETTSSVETLSHLPDFPALVLLEVAGFQGAGNAYALTLSLTAAGSSCPEDLLGFHAAPEQAVLLFTGATYENLRACPDVPDWYAVDLNGGETLEVTVSPASEASLVLDLFESPTGLPVASATSSLGADAVASTVAPSADRLYYRVSASTPPGGVPYTLLPAVTDPSGPCQADRLEPNAEDLPTDLAPGVHTWLRLCGQADQDAFRFPLDPFSTVSVLTSHAPGLGYTDLRLLSPTGAEIASSLDPDTGASLDALAEDPGLYTLVLDPFGAGASLPYDLAIFVD